MGSAVGEQVFNAVICGRLGMSVLVDGAEVYSFATTDDEPVRRQAEEFAYLFSTPRDFEFVQRAPLEGISRVLHICHQREQALDVLLILFDKAYPTDIRQDAAEDLKGLLADTETTESL